MSSPPPEEEPHPLFNTTYTLHTLTPLFSFPALTTAALKPHAKRFLQLLRGDVLRGVTIPGNSSEKSQLSRAGKLLRCSWTPLPPIPGEAITGVRIDLEHENTIYTALLLGSSPARTTEKEAFTNLPLLFTRMPTPLREPLLRYLSTTFDTLPLALALPDALLRDCLDSYIAESGGGGGKEVILTFAPRSQTEGLKRVSITVEGEDVSRFHDRVQGEEGWLAVLAGHLESVSGLRLGEVSLVKVAVGGFVLAAEGKGKFFGGGGEATRQVVEKVLKEAAGRGAQS
jgi:hypothetical protein